MSVYLLFCFPSFFFPFPFGEPFGSLFNQAGSCAELVFDLKILGKKVWEQMSSVQGKDKGGTHSTPYLYRLGKEWMEGQKQPVPTVLFLIKGVSSKENPQSTFPAFCLRTSNWINVEEDVKLSKNIKIRDFPPAPPTPAQRGLPLLEQSWPNSPHGFSGPLGFLGPQLFSLITALFNSLEYFFFPLSLGELCAQPDNVPA